MMWEPTVWEAMASAYSGADGHLALRLLAALDAAQSERGDIRGRQASGILIVGPERLDEPWRGVEMHLHADDHPEPLIELRRLVTVHTAYEHLQAAEEAELAGDGNAHARELRAALDTAPDMPEVSYWGALGLAAAGDLDAAEEMIRPVFALDPGWRELLRRLVRRGLVELPPDAVERLLD
jgi:hypothetical protein